MDTRKAMRGTINKNQHFFVLFWCLVTIARSGPQITFFNLHILIYIGFGFLLFSLLFVRWSRKEFIILFLLLGVGLLVYFVNSRDGLLITVLTLCGLKNVDLEKLIKVTLWVRLSVFLISIVAFILGFLVPQYSGDYRGDIWVVKHDFGFIAHPNYVSQLTFIIISLFIYIYYDRFKFQHALIILGGVYYIYQGTQTRTLIISVYVLLFAVLLMKMNILSRFRIALISFIPVLMLGSVGLVLVFGRNDTVNNLLQYRPWVALNVIERHGFSLIGRSVVGFYSEIAYVQMLVQSGFVIFLLYLVACAVLINQFYIMGKFNAIILLLGHSVYSLGEDTFINVYMNTALVFMSYLIYSQGKKDNSRLRHVSVEE